MAVSALAQSAHDEVVERGVTWLMVNTARGTQFRAAPIGLYFASLWYAEELYPLIFTVGALHAFIQGKGASE